MAFGKKKTKIENESFSPEELAKLGHKHEVEAAKDKKSSVYDHFHAQENAKAVADAKKRKKRYAIILTSLLSTLLVMYIISMLLTQWGDLVISVGDLGDDSGKTLLLSDNAAFNNGSVRLNGGSVQKVTNITKAWLPKGLDKKDGSHNGKNYLAYTFYLRNTGTKDLEYNTTMTITGVSKSADEAVRIQIYKNGKESTYAKGMYQNRKNAETDATKWVNNDTVIKAKDSALKAGDTDKYTVVMWIEGNDKECVDAIRGGTVRAQMVFDVVSDEEKEV